MSATLAAAQPRERTAFTLIELLVVVAIISILASMLLPALSNAREQGRRATCSNTMRNVYLASYMYVDDNEYYQTVGHVKKDSNSQAERWDFGWNGTKIWGWRLYSLGYVENPCVDLYCPKTKCDTQDPGDTGSWGAYKPTYNPGYAYTTYWEGGRSTIGWGHNAAYVVAPTITCMFAEVNAMAFDGYDGWTWTREDQGTFCQLGCGGSHGFIGRHLAGDNYMMVDGHVEYLKDPYKHTLLLRGRKNGAWNNDMRHKFPFNWDNDKDASR